MDVMTDVLPSGTMPGVARPSKVSKTYRFEPGSIEEANWQAEVLQETVTDWLQDGLDRKIRANRKRIAERFPDLDQPH